MDTYFGEIAALTAALSFSLTSVFFTLAGRKIDVITSLATSLPISLLILLPIHWLTEGEFFPVSAGLDRWLSLATSGILAFVVSSFFVLHAYQTLGPRLTMLIASIAPVLGAILAFFLLGQALPVNSILGIALVIFGIVWVVAEGNGRVTASGKSQFTPRDYLRRSRHPGAGIGLCVFFTRGRGWFRAHKRNSYAHFGRHRYTMGGRFIAI